jgi:hypothetical protein
VSDQLTIQDIEQESLAMVNDHLQDWCVFAREVLGVTLDEEQEAILRSVQHNPKTIVKSGTARGKDFISAVACVCFLYLTPEWNEQGELTGNTKVAMTAPTGRQVENIMYPEVEKLVISARARGFALPGRLVGNDIRMTEKSWFLTGFKADDNATEAWTGFHAVNVMFAVTEASGIDEAIFNAIEGNLQGNSRLLLVFNDNTGTGYAANAMKKPGWAKFRLDSLNAPNVKERRMIIPGQVDWQWVNDRVRDWCQVINPTDFLEEEGDFWWENDHGRLCYRPNDLFRVKVRGMAPKVSSGALIPEEWIRLAQKRWQEQQVNGWKLPMPLRIGVDVAGMGRDSSAFVPRRAHYVALIEMIHSGGQANHMEVAGRVAHLINSNTDAFSGATAQAFIDTIGEGAGVYSRGEELIKEGKLPKGSVHSVKFSEGANWNGQELKDVTGQYTFLNMRAYLYWAIRDWLNPAAKVPAMLPPDEELSQELMETRWFFRSNGAIQIEAKEDIQKRIGRSPDKADGLANTFYPVPDIDLTVKPKKNPANYFR